MRTQSHSTVRIGRILSAATALLMIAMLAFPPALGAESGIRASALIRPAVVVPTNTPAAASVSGDACTKGSTIEPADWPILICDTFQNNANSRRLTVLANPTLGAAYADIQQTDDGANAEYHGLLLSAQHRLSHGVSLQMNYNWSHCVSSWDFAGELAGVIYQNPLNRKTGERGNCGFDHRQNFVTNLVATSPGVGQSLLKTITRDWQLSPVVSMFTGSPIQLSAGKDISLSGQGLDRPEVLVPDAVYGSPKTLGTYLNLSSFACAGNAAGACSVYSGQFGNLGRNAIYAPGSINWDMAISRRFKLKERYSLDLRSDFFNIMNHANWGNGNGGGIGNSMSTTSTFGAITAFTAPRIIQMSLKLFF